MTFELLNRIIEENDIPRNVRLTSDSSWEGYATEMDGVFYNASENILVFTQGGFYGQKSYPYYDETMVDWQIEENKKWKLLYISKEY